MIRKLPVLTVATIAAFLSTQSIASDLVATITINPDAVVTTDHLVVTIHGNYTCGPFTLPDPYGMNWAYLQGSVKKATGRSITEGEFWFTPVCDGILQSFQASVPAYTIPWHGGKGRASAIIDVRRCDEFYNCENATGSTDVQITIKGGGK